MTRKMKDSGIEWIGDIPEDWEVVKIRHIALAESSGLSVNNLLDDGNYEVYDANKLVGYLDNNPVKTNYISIIKDGAGVGRTRLMQKNTNVIGTMNYIIAKNIDLNYLYYTLQVFDFEKYATGSTIPHIYFKDYANEYIALPNNKVQKDIVKHLDFEVDKIIKLVDKVNKQIENLENYKKSVITEAVTKGLDKNVEMKDSGIGWIGEIPKHWEVVKGKYILNLLKRLVRDTDEVITCFRDGEVTLRINRREDGFTFSDKEIGYQGINAGDLVVHGMDGFAGAIGISDSRGKGSPVLNVIDSSENKKYLMYYLRIMAYSDVFTALATGIRVRSVDLRWNKLANLFYPLPRNNEQNDIVDYLDKKTKLIDDSIAIKQRQLETLEEYKKSLIYEYVTGKKEVKDGEET